MTPTAYAKQIFDILPEAARGFAIVGGGALRAYFDRTTVKDYDLFFRCLADYSTVLAVLKHAGWEELPAPAGTSALLSPCGKLFNLIGFAFGSPREHIERFDFRCCAIAAWYDTYGVLHMIHDEGAIADAIQRRLVVRNNNGTGRTVQRIVRYQGLYGYSLDVPEVDDSDLDDEEDVPDTRVPIGTSEALLRYLKTLPKPSPSGGY